MWSQYNSDLIPFTIKTGIVAFILFGITLIIVEASGVMEEEINKEQKKDIAFVKENIKSNTVKMALYKAEKDGKISVREYNGIMWKANEREYNTESNAKKLILMRGNIK